MIKNVCVIAFVTLIFSVGLTALAYSQSQSGTNREEIVLTTYYPVPYGDYQNLRLWPSAQKECNENKRGTLYYDTDENKVMVCTLSSDNMTYAWQDLGLWSKNKDASTVYANNTSVNSGNWNAGIGTDIARAYDNRQTKLDVGDNVQGNGDGYVAVDDIYLKDPVSGQPGWASQTGGDLAIPLGTSFWGWPQPSQACPAGYSLVSINNPPDNYGWSASFICVKSSKIISGIAPSVSTYIGVP